MGTRLQDEGNSILNAVEEGTVNAVITLWDNEMINEKYFTDRKLGIKYILLDTFKFKEEQVDYWLDWFNVE